MPITTSIALEDNFEDILGKAQRGLGLSDEELASRSGITTEGLAALKQGKPDAAALASLAPVLGLHAPSWQAIARKAWYPLVPQVEGLAQITTNWKDFRVNAYLAWHPTARRAVVFDTGTTAAPLIEAVRTHKLTVELILLTHTHPDHVACLAELRDAFGAPKTCVSERAALPGAESMREGATFSLGTLGIEVRRTSGHAADGLTFVVRGLAQPVAVVGDALFAGSMGGAKVTDAWSEALQTNRSQIFSLPGETILCPGHGPLSTVAQEKQHKSVLSRIQIIGGHRQIAFWHLPAPQLKHVVVLTPSIPAATAPLTAPL